jgi:nucleolin
MNNSEPINSENKIFVKGLPWKASEQEVREFFQSCGDILSTEIPMRDDGKSLGVAYVKFKTREGLMNALVKDGEYWPGTDRWLKVVEGFVKPARKSFGATGVRPEGCNTIFVGNLPWNIEERHLQDLFSSCGEITSIRFASNHRDGSFKGFGYVEFAYEISVEEAVKLAGSDINGRFIKVDYATPRNMGGGRGRDRDNPRADSGRGRAGGSYDSRMQA